jgi:pimeloyl-ACP methyl ester carboxylesterase
VDLVGFSGGAAIACLAAARRNDVASVRTVAGNLDPDAVNRFHKVDGLKDSINPMSAALRLSGIPQLHFIGGRDTVILPSVAYDFAKRSGDFTGKTVIVVSNAGHNKGWADCWPGLLKMRPIKPSE